jgi:membrane associated rhomboid family serine protease
MNFIDLFKQKFREGDALIRLIFINVAVFVVLQTINILFLLFNQHFSWASDFLAAPASLTYLIHKPWTVITYMFLHEGLFHILFNMFALFWFGKLFLMYFSQKQLVALYIIGGTMGYVFFAGAYNLFPYFQNAIDSSVILGASGSIMAIILAVATKSPNMEMRMLFIGNIKLKYIAAIAVLMSFFGITSNNAGGEIAHLGGALTGYFFIVSLRQGKDITAWLNKGIDLIYDLFKPRKLKVRKNANYTGQKMSDAEYNQSKVNRMKEIDRILDKIKASGYESLSAEEKRKLFEQGKR